MQYATTKRSDIYIYTKQPSCEKCAASKSQGECEIKGDGQEMAVNGKYLITHIVGYTVTVFVNSVHRGCS